MKLPPELTIEKLLPHRAPMILIDGVEEFDFEKKTLTAWTRFDSTSVFYNAQTQSVPAYVGIELMAQSIAAFSGIFCRLVKNEEPNVGFVLGSRAYENFVGEFELGKRYTIRIAEEFLEQELGLFSCAIFGEDGALLAKGEVNVYRPASAKSFEELIEKVAQ